MAPIASPEVNQQPIRDVSRVENIVRGAVLGATLSLALAGCSETSPQQQVSAENSSTSAGEGTSTTRPRSTTTSEASTTTTTIPTPTTDAIRGVDFSNFALEADACRNGYMTWETQLLNGVGTHTDGSVVSNINLQPVVYGDVTGDGVEEAIVPLLCDPGTAGRTYPIWVYQMGETGAVHSLGALGTTSGQETLRAKPDTIAVEDQQIVVSGYHYKETDPTCCPSEKAIIRWGFLGSTFEIDSIEVTETIEQTPEVTQPPYQISVDGIGPIKLGMTQTEIVQLGYSAAPSCGDQVSLIGDSADLTAFFDQNGLLTALQTDSPKYSTPSGISPGSPSSKVPETYGANVNRQLMQGNTGPFPVYVFESEQARQKNVELLFSDVGGEVKFITLTRPGGAPLLC